MPQHPKNMAVATNTEDGVATPIPTVVIAIEDVAVIPIPMPLASRPKPQLAAAARNVATVSPYIPSSARLI